MNPLPRAMVHDFRGKPGFMMTLLVIQVLLTDLTTRFLALRDFFHSTEESVLNKTQDQYLGCGSCRIRHEYMSYLEIEQKSYHTGWILKSDQIEP